MKNSFNIFWTDTSEIVEDEQLSHFSQPFQLKRKSTVLQNFRQKKQSVISKNLLAYGLNFLGEDMPESINYRNNGKPYFEDSELNFNISHSGKLVICAISKNKMGIDLQEILPLKKGVEGVFLDADERQIVHPDNYLKVWSQKEASYKGFGFEYCSRLTEFKYASSELMVHQSGEIKLIEQKIAEGFYCFLAIEPETENQINVFQVSVNQLTI